MKIIVNGKIIDTENIYSIGSKIETGMFDDFEDAAHYFVIESLNGKTEVVHSPITDMKEVDDIIKLHKNVYVEQSVWDSLDIGGKRRIVYDYLNGVVIKKISQMRMDIEKVWLDNQTKLESFNILEY